LLQIEKILIPKGKFKKLSIQFSTFNKVQNNLLVIGFRLYNWSLSLEIFRMQRSLDKLTGINKKKFQKDILLIAKFAFLSFFFKDCFEYLL